MPFKPSVFLVKGVQRYGPTVRGMLASRSRLFRPRFQGKQVLCRPNWLFSSGFPVLYAFHSAVLSESEFNARPWRSRGGHSLEADGGVNSGGGLSSCDQPPGLATIVVSFRVCHAGTSSWGNLCNRSHLISERSRTLPPQLTHLFSELFFCWGGDPPHELSGSKIIRARATPAQGLRGPSEGPGRGRETIISYPSRSGCLRLPLATGRLQLCFPETTIGSHARRAPSPVGPNVLTGWDKEPCFKGTECFFSPSSARPCFIVFLTVLSHDAFGCLGIE